MGMPDAELLGWAATGTGVLIAGIGHALVSLRKGSKVEQILSVLHEEYGEVTTNPVTGEQVRRPGRTVERFEAMEASIANLRAQIQSLPCNKKNGTKPEAPPCEYC